LQARAAQTVRAFFALQSRLGDTMGVIGCVQFPTKAPIMGFRSRQTAAESQAIRE
jgi:hypothetical protein